MSEKYDDNVSKAYTADSGQNDEHNPKFDGVDRLIIERSIMRSVLNKYISKLDHVMALPGD